MMSRCVRAFLLAALGGPLAAGCAATDVATADPEAQQLDPPVVIIDEPEPEAPGEPAEATAEAPPPPVVMDPQAEVITFVGADASPGMADQVTGSPKRDPLPSMISEVLSGPNK